MGFRTTVCLINDQMHEWSKDPDLGRNIANTASFNPTNGRRELQGGYGSVLEVTHADTQRLAVIDSYHMDTLSIGHWSSSEDLNKMRDLALLKQAAAKLGYKLVKEK